jgi:hypothetical protein
MENIQVRKAAIDQLATLQSLAIATFLETYADSNTPQDIETYVADNFNEIKMTGEINHPDSAFYIAWEGQNAIGYLKLNTASAQTEIQDKQALEIERIYV